MTQDDHGEEEEEERNSIYHTSRIRLPTVRIPDAGLPSLTYRNHSQKLKEKDNFKTNFSDEYSIIFWIIDINTFTIDTSIYSNTKWFTRVSC